MKAGTILFAKILEEVSLPTTDGDVLMDKKSFLFRFRQVGHGFNCLLTDRKKKIDTRFHTIISPFTVDGEVKNILTLEFIPQVRKCCIIVFLSL